MFVGGWDWEGTCVFMPLVIEMVVIGFTWRHTQHTYTHIFFMSSYPVVRVLGYPK